MRLIWKSIKLAGTDLWDELLYLILLNFICLVGTLLIIPWPFVTFGLFFVMYDVSQGKGVKFDTFFKQPAKLWKQAYLWGLTNIGIAAIVWVNLNFYAAYSAQWARMVQIFFVGVGLTWFVLQLAVLPMYPRLKQPGLKLVFRNAFVLLARYPGLIIALLLLTIFVGAISIYVPLLIIFCAVSGVAVVANQLVGNAVANELAEGNIS
jgi:uncharacterized membrane protein YesL